MATSLAELAKRRNQTTGQTTATPAAPRRTLAELARERGSGGSQPSEGRTAPWGKTYGADSCVTYVKDYLKHNYGKSVSNLRSLKKVGSEYLRPGAVLELSPIGEYTVPHWAVVNPDGKTVSEFQSNKKNNKSYPIGIKNSRTVSELSGRIKNVYVIPAADVQKQPAKPLTKDQQWQGGWQFSEPQVDTRTAVAGGMGYSGGPGGGTRPQPKPAAGKTPVVRPNITQAPAAPIPQPVWKQPEMRITEPVAPEPKKRIIERVMDVNKAGIEWQRNAIKSAAEVALGFAEFPVKAASTAIGYMNDPALFADNKKALAERTAFVEHVASKAGAAAPAVRRVLSLGTPMSGEELQQMIPGTVAAIIEGYRTAPEQLKTGEIAPLLSSLAMTVAPLAHGVKMLKGKPAVPKVGEVPKVAEAVRPVAEPPVAARPVAPLAEAPATLEAMARARTAAQSQYRADVRRLKPPVEATPGRATTPTPPVAESRVAPPPEPQTPLMQGARMAETPKVAKEPWEMTRAEAGIEPITGLDLDTTPRKGDTVVHATPGLNIIGVLKGKAKNGAWIVETDAGNVETYRNFAVVRDPQSASTIKKAFEHNRVVDEALSLGRPVPTNVLKEQYEWAQTRTEYRGRDFDHEVVVEAALREGKPVPAEVLADYPDLAAKYASPSKPSVTPAKPPVAAKPTGGAVAPKAAAETGVAKPPPAKVVAQQADAVPDAQLAEVLQAGDEFKKNILANTRQYNTDVTKPHRSETHLIPTDAEIRKGFTQPQLEYFKDALKAEIPDALAKPGGEFVVKIPDDGTFTVPKTPQAIGLHLNTLGEAKPKLTAPVKISRDARVLQYDGSFGEAVTSDGRPVWTNGAMLEFDNPPSGFRQVADSKSALRVVKPDNILAWAESKGKSQPLEYVGTSFGWSQEGVKPTTSPNGPKAAKPGDAIVFRSSDGSLIAVDAKYHNYFAGKYKGARFGAIAEEGKSPIITVSVGGKTKAYVMPLADDVIPSQFRDVAPQKPTPTARAASEGALKAASEAKAAGKVGEAAQALDEVANAALDRIKQRGNKLTAGVDPFDLADITVYAAAKIAKGAVTSADFAAHLAKQFGPEVAKRARQIWEDAVESLRKTGHDVKAYAWKAAAKSGESKTKYAGSVNLDKWNTVEDIKQWARDTYESKKTEIDKQRRGVRSHEETIKASRESGMTAEFVKTIKPGTALNAEQVYAVAEETIAAQTRAIQLAKRLDDIKSGKAKGNIETAEAEVLKAQADADLLFKVLNGTSSEAGRALNIHKAARSAYEHVVSKPVDIFEPSGPVPPSIKIGKPLTAGFFAKDGRIFKAAPARAAWERLKTPKQSYFGEGAVMGGIPVTPQMLADMVEVGGYLVDRGAVEFGAWANRMRKEVGEGIDLNEPLLRDVWEKIRIKANELAAQSARQPKTLKTEALRELGKLVGGKENVTAEMLTELAKIDDANAVALGQFLKEHHSVGWGTRVEQYRYANLFSGTNPHWRNLIGNITQGALIPVEKVAAFAVDAVRVPLLRVFGINTPKRYYMGELPAAVKAYFGSFPQAAKAGWETLKHGMNPLELERKIEVHTRYDLPDIKVKGKSYQNPFNMPIRLLGAVDEAARTTWRAGIKEAHRFRAEKSGKPVRPDIEQYAEAESMYYAQMEPFSKFMERIVDVVDYAVPKDSHIFPGLRPARLIVPVFRTATNMLKKAWIDYSPLGMTKAFGGEFSKTTGRVLAGTGSIVTAIYLHSQGKLTGAAPDSPNERKIWYEAGNQPYTVKIGNKAVPFMALGIVGLQWAAIADYLDAGDRIDAKAKQTGEPDTNKLLKQLQASIEGQASAAPFFAGINQLIDLAKQTETAVVDLAANVIYQHIPASGMLRHIARATDPSVKETGRFTDVSMGQSLAEKLRTDIPGLSKGVPARVNPVTGGKTVRQNAGGIKSFFPYTPTTLTNDPVVKELMRLKVYPSGAGKAFKSEGKTRRLTRAEYQAYERELAVWYSSVAMEMKTPNYKSGDDEYRAERLKTVMDLSHKLAQGKYKSQLGIKPAASSGRSRSRSGVGGIR